MSMQRNKSNIVNKYDKENKDCNICAYRNCSKKGLYSLRILYFNKIAYFCLDHKEDLLNLELVIES